MKRKVRLKRSSAFRKFKGKPMMYDSDLQARRGELLSELYKQGTITDLKVGNTVVLGSTGIRYSADFSYVDSGIRVYEEVKGVMTDRFRMISKIWPITMSSDLRVVREARQGWTTFTIYGKAGS